MTRLFIGLPIDDTLRTALRPVYELLSGHDHLLKAVPPENYHITVKFLGECEGNVANAIESTFLEIPAPEAEIPFTLSGLGAGGSLPPRAASVVLRQAMPAMPTRTESDEQRMICSKGCSGPDARMAWPLADG